LELSVVQIVENEPTELNELCIKLDVHCFNERELQFLTKYCKVLKPLVRGLDKLQGEDDCYYGTLLPTLETILKKVKPELSSMRLGLADCMKTSIHQSFNGIFNSKSAIIAVVTVPKFKL